MRRAAKPACARPCGLAWPRRIKHPDRRCGSSPRRRKQASEAGGQTPTRCQSSLLPILLNVPLIDQNSNRERLSKNSPPSCAGRDARSATRSPTWRDRAQLARLVEKAASEAVGEPDQEERIQRDHVCVVFQLLRERFRQSGKPPHRHSHREVRPFSVGRTDVFRIWTAGDFVHARPDAFRGAVASACRVVRCGGVCGAAGRPSLQALRQGPRHALGRFDLRSRFRRVHCHQHRDGKHRCGPASAPAPQDAKGG